MSRISGNAQAVDSIQHSLESIDIGQSQADDEYLGQVIKAVQQRALPPDLTGQQHQLFLQDSLDRVICCRFQATAGSIPRTQVLVPSCLQHTVLNHLHDQSGHCGVSKTVRERYYWPGYERDIENYVRACRPCQLRKSLNHKTLAPLGTIKTDYPFQCISWDITGPLPETERGNRYILVVTDLFIKWVEAFPLKATDSGALANVLVDDIVCRYELT